MRFNAPWRKVSCPFCQTRFPLRDALWRSLSGKDGVDDDTRLAAFLGTAPEPRARALPRRSPWDWLFVRHDPDSDRVKVCPNCHLALPTAIASGELSGDVIAVVGAYGSGKSNYLGVLLNRLNAVGESVGFTAVAKDTFDVREMKEVTSERLYRRRYHDTLFTNRQAIPQTDSARHNPDTRIPLIYRLRFEKPFFQRLVGRSPYVPADLVLYDAAGEDFEDPVSLELFCRYVLRASGIIFLVDPLAYPALRAKLPGDVRRRVERQAAGGASGPRPPTTAEVLQRVIDLFEKRADLRAGAQLSIPVAVVVTKADMLAPPIIEAGSAIHGDSRHEGGFDVEDAREVSGQMRQYLRDWDDGSGIATIFTSQFRNVSFFAVSALGELPNEDLQINAIHSRRIADPLLWLLHQRGYLPAMPPRKLARRGS